MTSPKSLKSDATSGFFWLFGQSIVSRVVTFGSQVVLAWILSPEAFGTIGLAYSVMAFATVFQEGGVSRVLIAEQNQFGKLSNSAFWLSVVFGLATGFVVAAAASFVGAAYDSSELPGLLWVLAATLPLQAVRSMPDAALSIDLRFGTRTKLGVLELAGQQLLTVAFALMGFGVYSFVLPVMLVAPVVTYLFFRKSGFRPGWLEVRHWPELLAPSGQLMIAAVLAKIVDFGDYLILGSTFDKATVGLYFLAYTLSVQGVMLVVNSLGNMLFPVLSRLRQEPERQRDAFMRIARIGAGVAIPFSLFVAFNATPIVHTLYGTQWHGAATLLMILSLGMAFRVLSAATFSTLNAQGRFHLVVWNNGLRAVAFGVLAVPAVSLGVVWFACAVALTYVAEAVIGLYLLTGVIGDTFRSLRAIVNVPFTAGILAGGLCLSVQFALPAGRIFSLLSLLVGAGVYLVACTIIMRWFSATIWHELTRAVRTLRGHTRGVLASTG